MEQFRSLAAAVGLKRLALMGGVGATVIAGLLALSLQASKPRLGLLYTDLDPGQAKLITDRLSALDVPYELTRDGSAVLAPEDDMPRLRMELAGEQMGGPIGYEILDKQDALGTTSFLQNVNHVRAIEGELARSIQSITSVQSARVHLSIPERALFERDARDPTAAITLRTRTTLATGQVAAIRNLVAAAVPGLSPGHISIIDQNGTLLAASGEDGGDGLMSSLEEKRTGMETRLRSQVETMLEQIVGPGKARAEVSIELESEDVRKEAEVYDPDAQVVARQTTVERADQNADSESGGEVGVSNNLPENQAETAAGGPTSKSQSNETSEQVDYANSRTKTTTVRESGSLKRLSVAVMVDGITTNGNYAPRNPAELEKLSRLVESAVGFNEERGDSVVVENLPFLAPTQTVVDAEESLPLGLKTSDLVSMGQTLAVGLVAVLAFFLLLRPLLRKNAAEREQARLSNDALAALPGSEERLALSPPENSEAMTAKLVELAADGDDNALEQLRQQRQQKGPLGVETEIDIAQIEGKVKAAAIRKVGEVITRHPAESASVVRQWMYS